MRLIVVSNRAPVTVVDEDGRHTYRQSVGGLATGLRSYLDLRLIGVSAGLFLSGLNI